MVAILEAPVLTTPTTAKPDAGVKHPLRMTYEEYLAWADEDVLAEWKDGEVEIEMPPKHPHQTIVEFLLKVIGLFVDTLELGFIRVAPFETRLWPSGPAREPDLMFVARENYSLRLTAERIVGPPDLVIEIVSDSSVVRDRVEKLDEYERAGVREYWIIDNRAEVRRAWFYSLGEQDQFARIIVGPDGIFRSRVLEGFWLKLDWLWQDEPDALRALAEVVGPERMAEVLRERLAAAVSS